MKLPLRLSLRVIGRAKLLNENAVNKNSVRHIYLLDESNNFGPNKTTQISEASIQQKLKDCVISFENGHACFFIQGCGLCCKTKKVKSDKTSGLYINRKTGFFLCDKCKVVGNWNVLSHFLDKCSDCFSAKNKDHSLQNENCEKYEKSPNLWDTEVVERTIPLHSLDNETFVKVFDSMNLVPCSEKIAEQLQIRIDPDHTQLYLPMFTNDTTVVGYKSVCKNFKVITTPSFDCPGFLRSPSKHTVAVVVSQVPDFFALLSQQLSMDILCLPHGISNLPQISLPFLEKYKKLIFWLGGANTLDATGNFTMKLDRKRCCIVKPTNNQVSASTALAKGENIPNILATAKTAWHESIIDFNALREEVLAELQNKDQCAGVTWKRFPVLNRILKGHRRGEVTVLTGPTGSGKTTFISEYSLDLAMQGVNTLWGSFEIKNSRLAKKMLQQFAGMPMEDNLEKFDYWADKFEELPIYFMTFHGQQPLHTVMDAVEHSSYVYDIAHVVIDNVQFMIDITPDSVSMDRFWKQDVLIQSFRSFASKFNCHVTLVMHPKKGMDGLELSINSIFGGAKATQEADNVLIIQNISTSSYGVPKKVLQITKNRFCGDLGIMPLVFDKNSFGFSKTGDTVDENKCVQEPVKIEISDHWRNTVTEYEEHEDEGEERQQNWKNKAPWDRLMRL